MKHVWAIFWSVLVFAGLWWLMNEWGLRDWLARVAILFGAILGVLHVIYSYEEIACTCDDPDHEH